MQIKCTDFYARANFHAVNYLFITYVTYLSLQCLVYIKHSSGEEH